MPCIDEAVDPASRLGELLPGGSVVVAIDWDTRILHLCGRAVSDGLEDVCISLCARGGNVVEERGKGMER